MILFIDTTDFNSVTFGLAGKKTRAQSYKIDSHESHLTLSKLDKFLKGNKIKSASIKKIVVNKGPGSFTGVRIGVVMAQALGFAWDIPIKTLAKDKFEIILSK